MIRIRFIGSSGGRPELSARRCGLPMRKAYPGAQGLQEGFKAGLDHGYNG